MVRACAVIAGLLAALAGVLAGQAHAVPPATPSSSGTGEWPVETIVLLPKVDRGLGPPSEMTLRGLVEEESPQRVQLTEVHQSPDRPTWLVVRTIPRTEIKSIVRLPPSAREELQRRISQLRRRAEVEAADMGAVQLTTAKSAGIEHFRFQGTWFALESTLDEESTRRFVVRTEQAFAAFGQVLPARVRPASSLRIELLGSSDEYHKRLEARGLHVDNPAVFLERDNVVLAGLDRLRFAAQWAGSNAELARRREEYRMLKQSLHDRLEQLARQLRQQRWSDAQARDVLNKARRQAETELDKGLKQLAQAERENDRAFAAAAREMLVRLYHESFHAYLENYVYPHRDYDVPRWLNEGLAMVFEQAVVESGSLRIGAPHPQSLARLKDALHAPQQERLRRALTADAGQFLVTDHSRPDASRELYDYSWGAVYYLTFGKQWLAGPQFAGYVSKEAQALAPVPRFEQATGIPLAEFEEGWRRYLLSLCY